MKPFAKWPGGKTQLLTQLKSRMQETFGKYYEPFVGSGALLLDEQPGRAVINDVNESLLNVYRQLRTDAESHFFAGVFCVRYLKTEVRYGKLFSLKKYNGETERQ